MGLETGSFISDLVPTNPLGGDQRSTADDHIRLIKTVAKATFPNGDRAQYFPRHLAKTGTYAILATDMERHISGDATGGAFSLTLPSLAAGNDGWSVRITKIDASANAITIVGTINGETNISLANRWQSVVLVWSGTAWVAMFPIRVIAGVPTFASAAIVGNATVGGTLGVTGDTTVQKLTISGALVHSITTEPFYGAIFGSLSNRDYRIIINATEGGTITATTTRCVSGTATATFKINTTALGGTANAVSSSEQTQVQASNNVFVAGDDIVITISSNSSCVDLTFGIKWTRALS